MRHSWTEQELGLDPTGRVLALLPDGWDTLSDGSPGPAMLSPEQETITLVICHQIPLKRNILEGFVAAGGQLLDYAPCMPLPQDYYPKATSILQAKPGQWHKLAMSLNGKALFCGTNTHGADLLRACTKVSAATSRSCRPRLRN